MATKYDSLADGLDFDFPEPGLLRLTLNAPNGNILSEPMLDGLSEIWIDVDRDPDVRCVLVQGAGDCFTAGSELANITNTQVTTKSVRPQCARLVGSSLTWSIALSRSSLLCTVRWRVPAWRSHCWQT